MSKVGNGMLPKYPNMSKTWRYISLAGARERSWCGQDLLSIVRPGLTEVLVVCLSSFGHWLGCSKQSYIAHISGYANGE